MGSDFPARSRSPGASGSFSCTVSAWKPGFSSVIPIFALFHGSLSNLHGLTPPFPHPSHPIFPDKESAPPSRPILGSAGSRDGAEPRTSRDNPFPSVKLLGFQRPTPIA